MPDPTCFKCNSKFKVTQVEPGIYCCGGFCLKHYRQRKDMALEKGKMAPSAPQDTSHKFKVGDFCRGTYAEDGVEYEGKIIAMQQEPSSRDEYATVLFLGYGNEATLWTSELKPSLGEEARSKQADAAAQEETPAEATLKPKSRQWNVDDPCRSIYSVDQIEYEGVIKDIKADPDSGSKYAIVEFIGYGNQETVWFEDLMASSGESARLKQIAEAGADSSSSSPERSSPTVWKAGDRCRAIFSEDHLEYEGVLTTVDASEDGKKYATIEFYGYGNVETVWVDDLLPSQGDEARAQQAKEAGVEVPDGTANPHTPTETAPSNENEKSVKSWSVGDLCRAIFSEDGLEYEGEVLSLDAAEDGRKFCVVRFYGYGNDDTVWIEDLIESHGEEARAKQAKEAGVEVEAQTAPVTPDSPSTTPPSAQEQPQPKIGDFCCFLSSNNNLTEAQVSSVDKDDTGKTYFIVDICGSNMKETVWPEEILPSKGVSAREKQVHIAAAAAAVSPPSSPSTPDAIEPEEEKYPSPTGEWCIGDEVRAVYSADGLEYEGNILSLESKDGRPFCVVKFFGFGNEEFVWVDQLIPSRGVDARNAQARKAASVRPTSPEPSCPAAHAQTATKIVEKNLPSSSEEIEKLTLRLAEVETELSCVTKDRDSALAAVANLKISKEVLSKSNLELYEKLSKQNKTEKEVAIKNLQVAKEKISQLEADYRKLEEKHSKSLKENAEDIRKLIAKIEVYRKEIEDLKSQVKAVPKPERGPSLNMSGESSVEEFSPMQTPPPPSSHATTNSATSTAPQVMQPFHGGGAQYMQPMIYPMMMPQPIAGSETPGNGNGAPMMFYAMAPMPMFNPAQNSSSSSVAAPSVSNGVGETPVPLRKPKYNPSRVHHANVAPQEC